LTHHPHALKVAVAPLRSLHNPFAGRFAQSIAPYGLDATQFSWHPAKLFRTDVAILHWPDEFFVAARGVKLFKTAVKLTLLKAAQAFKGTRFIWVAHNARPHDAPGPSSRITRMFIRSLDGIVYLSHYSQEAIHALYPSVVTIPDLVIVHGHYRDDSHAPLKPPPLQGEEVTLAYFGQIRPYKNVDKLVECVSGMEGKGVRLTVTGLSRDEAFTARLVSMAQSRNHIRLDLRPQLVPDADLEAAIDSSHAVVLPYRDILNSGSALLALSRDRPVLAPRIGSFPELQASVGADWVYLYDGELSIAVLEQFADWLRKRDATLSADLSTYDWKGIGRSLSSFIERVSGR
jgi:glycosyltransferase involved in cell wall biosynthesis